ncbi:hypothetical protein [Mycobacterium sp. Root135]|uniref:hypothetical protein n=1 Tax=Mycobacterium sp. Root135 TaxID=1736457 RepID=UPI0012EAF261|nr:hypothetical protein [Mycobacterium sp. Root135]
MTGPVTFQAANEWFFAEIETPPLAIDVSPLSAEVATVSPLTEPLAAGASGGTTDSE